MPADVAWHVRRYERLKATRGLFDWLWQEVAEFLVPHKSIITRQRRVGERQTDAIMDATQCQALNILGATISGSLTSSAIPWFHLKMRNESLNELKDVQDWLEECENRMYLALRQSNFNEESHEMYLDLAGFGTGCLYVEERPRQLNGPGNTFGGFRFRADSIGSYVIDEDPEGRVDTVYRRWKLTAKACVQRFGLENVGDRIRNIYENRPDEMVEVLHCVGPRDLYDPKKVGGKNMKYYSLYIALPQRKLLSEGGYQEFPYLVPRWSKTPGEMYGRGPGILALPDIRTLNQAVQLVLQAGARALDPPVEVPDDGVIGAVDMRAGGLNTVDHTFAQGGQSVIRPIETGAKFDVSQVLTEDLRTRIREAFYNQQMQLPEKVMTATEVEKQWEIMRRVLGPTLGRLESEYLNPLIDRTFALMLRAGALPVPPDVLNQSDGNLDVEYEGPLARSQKVQRLVGFEQFIQLVTQVAAIDPESAKKMMQNMDLDPAARELMNIAGLASQWVLDPRTRDAQRAQMAQAAQQQMQLSQIEQAAGAAGKITPAFKAMKDMGGAMAGAPNGAPPSQTGAAA